MDGFMDFPCALQDIAPLGPLSYIELLIFEKCTTGNLSVRPSGHPSVRLRDHVFIHFVLQDIFLISLHG